MKKQLKHIGAIILLLLFVSMKAAPLHSISHQDGEQESCMICTYVLESSEILWLAPEAIDSQQCCQPSYENFTLFKSQADIFSQSYHFVLFSRPPPTV